MTQSEALLILKPIVEHLSDGLDAGDWQAFEAQITVQVFDTGDILLEANQIYGSFWFIARGLIRNFYITEDGKEFNKAFLPAPSFCGAMSEWVGGKASRYSIQAMMPVTALRIPMDWMRVVIHERPAFARLLVALLSELAWRKERREAAFLLDDATCRYQQCVRELEGLAEHIPAYQLASYLGITEVALSRIKRRLREQRAFPFQ